MYQKIAIITGASSGIGKAFIELLAGDKGEFFKNPFDEIWAVARRGDALNELASSVKGVKIVPVVADLASDSGIKTVEEKLKAEEPKVGLLINSAGMGVKGQMAEKPYKALGDTIKINCQALSEMINITVPYMKPEGNNHSKIINIGSSAGFLPQPGFACYAASKSYVISFSRAMSCELKPKGIDVLVVCPGPVATDFQRRATDGKDAPRGTFWGSPSNFPIILLMQRQDKVRRKAACPVFALTYVRSRRMLTSHPAAAECVRCTSGVRCRSASRT